MEQIYTPKMINLTPDALSHLSNQVEQNDAIGLLLSLKKSGCAGYKFDWQFIHGFAKDENLVKINYDNFILAFDPSYQDMFNGIIIDLKNKELEQTKLEIVAPKATSMCGCGTSVSFGT